MTGEKTGASTQVWGSLLIFALAALAALTAGCGGDGGGGLSGRASPRGDARAGVAYWESLPPSLLERLEGAAVRVGRSIYVVGGWEQQGTVLGSIPLLVQDTVPSARLERYDIDTGEWTLLTGMPIHFDHLRAVEYQGDIYVSGGHYTPPVASNLFWKYDIDTDTWSAMPAMPLPTMAHAAGVIGDQMIVAGGANLFQATTAVQIFDFTTQSWSRGPDLPQALEHTNGVVHDGYLYVLTGKPGSLSEEGILPDVYRWKPGMDVWERRADVPHPRAGAGAAVVCNRIVVAAGENPAAGTGSGLVPEVDLYDPATDRWFALPEIPYPRHGVMAAADGNRMYVIQGGEVEIFGYTNEVSRLTLDCDALGSLPPATGWGEEAGETGLLCAPGEVPVAGGQCLSTGGSEPGGETTAPPKPCLPGEVGGNCLPEAGA